MSTSTSVNDGGEEGKLLLPADGSGASNKEAAPIIRRGKRLVSLDATRGFTVAVMVFVDNTGGVLMGHVNHSPWNHVTYADFVMPFFLFMVGMSMSLSMRKYKEGLFTKVFWRTVKLFVLGLLTQGGGFPAPFQGGFDLKYIRVPGILQRIAWAYFIVACMAMFLPKLKDAWRDSPSILRYFHMFRVYTWHWIVAFAFFFLYLALMFGVKSPSWSFTTQYHKLHGGNIPDGCTLVPANLTHPVADTLLECHVECDVSGDLSPKCSATRAVDMWLLGWNHMYDGGEFSRLPECSSCYPGDCPLRPELNQTADAWCLGRLDPEGVLSSVPTVLSTWLGLFFGNVLVHHKENGTRLRYWSVYSVSSFALGLLLSIGWKMNKQLWSPSYVFMMAGACGFFAIFFYLMLDWRQWQPRVMSHLWTFPFRLQARLTDVFKPLVWVGMNTIFIYLMAPSAGVFESIQSYFYWDSPDNTILHRSMTDIFCQSPTCPTNTTHVEGCQDNTCGYSCEFATCTGGIVKGGTVAGAQVLMTICRITAWVGVAGLLHWRKWYWAV